MAITSNFYRVTPQILLEYRSNQYNIINNQGIDGYTQPSKYYIYKGNDDNIYYTEAPKYTSSADYYKNMSIYQMYPDENGTSFEHITDSRITIANAMNYQTSSVVKYSEEKTNASFYYDQINIYFIRGFNFDNIDGFTLQVKSKANYDINEDDGRHYTKETDATIFCGYVSKDLFNGVTTDSQNRTIIRYLKSPLFMNSKFYDRYITIEFPSLYGIALKDYADVMNPSYTFVLDNVEYKVNPNANTIIDFATVSSGKSDTTAKVRIGSSELSAVRFTTDSVVSASMNPEVSSDYFNVRIYEDPNDHSIIYYPTYGDSTNSYELDGNIMAQIEAGAIPVTTNSFYDLNTADDDINDVDYGGDSLYYNNDSDDRPIKWKIYNDLNVTYVYKVGNSDYGYDEAYSRIIDYSKNAEMNTVEYWRTRFVPNKNIIEKIGAYAICLKYTCRLVNVYKAIEAIRIATLTVDANNYMDDIKNYLNVNTYKIVNKINRTTQNIVSPQENIKEKYIRSYYNSTNLVAKNIGTGANIYTQGQMTLRLYRTSSNYLVQLFNINDDNARIPYDLTGPYKYKIVFPLLDGTQKLAISPNPDSTKQNLGIGTLVFYITGEQAEQIMSVPAANRYFAIMTDTGDSAGQETTLYQGNVAWL